MVGTIWLPRMKIVNWRLGISGCHGRGKHFFLSIFELPLTSSEVWKWSVTVRCRASIDSPFSVLCKEDLSKLYIIRAFYFDIIFFL